MTGLAEKIFRQLPLYAAMLLLTIFTGCVTVGPDYKKPEINTPDRWNSSSKEGIRSEGETSNTLAAWWTSFNDSELNSLIDRAIKGNPDIKKAKVQIQESRARRGASEAGLFPTLNFSTSKTWTRDKETNSMGMTTDKYSSEFSPKYSVGFDSGWEIDIFGGTRRSIESSQADLEAVNESLNDVLTSLLAELALNYVEVRTYQTRINTVEENLKIQEETYQLTIWRNQAGLTDDVSVQQALYNLENTKSQLPSLNTGLEESMNRIAILLGEDPGNLHQELTQTGTIPSASDTIAVGVPADVLRQRPDIRKAERNLASQTARVGVAEADLYPKLSLNGSIGVDALSYNKFVKGLGNSDYYSMNFGPSLTWAIFQGGTIRQNIKIQSSLQEQALITYESTIKSALEEVENALTAYSNEQKRYANLKEAVKAAQTAATLSEQQFQAGLTDFNTVLDSQRSLLSYQDQLDQSSGTVTSDLIRLYKALGGGWNSFNPDSQKTQL